MSYKSKYTGEQVDDLLTRIEEGDLDITIDQELSSESPNAIANSTVTMALRKKVSAEEVSSSVPTVDFPQVLHTPQNLTNEQKSVARENIYAMPATPSGDPMHYAYEAAGAVWNEDTGYWVLNGGEFDNDTIRLAYWRGNQRIFPLSSAILYLSHPLVVNFPAQNVALNSYEKRLMMGDIATNNSQLERVRLTTNIYDVFVGDLNYAFYGCSKLIVVEDVLNIGFAENVNSETFAYCTSLVGVRLKGLRSDISFADSPLSVESATYMIANANASSSFTITFRADRQAIFEANSDFIAAKSAKPNITILYQ